MILQNLVGAVYFVALITFVISWVAAVIGFPSNFFYSSFAFLIGSKLGMMVSSKVKGTSVFALFLITVTTITLTARYLAGTELHPNWLLACICCTLGIVALWSTSPKSSATAAEFLAKRLYFYGACFVCFGVCLSAAWASDFVTNPVKTTIFFLLAVASIFLTIKHIEEYPLT